MWPTIGSKRSLFAGAILCCICLMSLTAPMTGQAQTSGGAVLEQTIIELTNAERAKAGLLPLRPNAQLAQAARDHSQAMADHDFFAHENPLTGSDPGKRAAAIGYQWRDIAENIGLGYDSPQAMVQSWMNSPGHRANILRPEVREIGVGYVLGPGPGSKCKNPPCQHYWTQVFGLSANEPAASSSPTGSPTIRAPATATPIPSPLTASPPAITPSAVVVARAASPVAATRVPVTPTAQSGPTAPPPKPITVTLSLCPETSSPQRIEVTLPPAPIKADVLFLFDVTSSMAEVLTSAASNADIIMNDLGWLIPDIQFGVVSVGDYPTRERPAAAFDMAYTQTLRITADQAAVRAALKSLKLQDGGDAPEAYSKGFYQAATDPAIGWRDGARHLIVSFGDSVPHDDDLNAGVPSPQPYRAGQPWNEAYDPVSSPVDNLDWQTVLADLKAREITVLHVVSGTAFGDVPPQSLRVYWQHWAGLTGGEAVLQEDATQLPDTIRALVARASRRISMLRLVPSDAYANWVQSSPPEYRDLAVPDTGLIQAFQTTIRPPKGTADGAYAIHILVVGDGTTYVTWTAVVQVDCGVKGCVVREERCKHIFPWLLIPWLTPLLLLLLVVLLWWLAQRLIFGPDWREKKRKRGLLCWLPCLLALLWALLLAFLLAQRLSDVVCQTSEQRPLEPPPADLRIVTPTSALVSIPMSASTVTPTPLPPAAVTTPSNIRASSTPTAAATPFATIPSPTLTVGNGSRRVALVGPMPDPALPGVTVKQLPISQVLTDTLRNFDTLVLAQQCDVGDWPRQIQCAINQWVAAGGKLIIYDSDECNHSVDYSWLPYPFTTDNPGAQGSTNGEFKIVADDTMISSKPGPAFVDEAALSRAEIGDANVMITRHLAWCGDAEARNLHGRRGFVHAYAFWGKGLIIYNGLDTDSIGTPAMRQLWENELKQEWEGITGVRPAGLTCRTRVAGSPFYPIDFLGISIPFWLPWLLLPLLFLLCWLLCRPSGDGHGDFWWRLPVPPGPPRGPAEFLDVWAGPKVEWKPTPTVVVGLGGAGRWVLTYLKHNLAVAGAGREPGPVRLLCLDSRREERVGSQDVEVQFAGEQLGDDELAVVGEDLSEVLRRAAEEQEPELAAWLPIQDYAGRLRPAEQDAREGTGQRRPIGRAVVFRDIQRGEAGSAIWRRLVEALSVVQREGQAQVIIVASLAGGFGSGALADVAYLARLAAARAGVKGAPVSAFLATEDVFATPLGGQQAGHMRVNVMAALRELNRFLLAQNRPYPMRYRIGGRDDLGDRFLNQSLLDDCFIFDGHRLQQDLTNRPPQDGIFPAMADALQVLIDKGARDPASTLAQHRSNMRTRAAGEQVNRGLGVVGGLGCSVYRLPLVNLARECNGRFARELLGRWLVGRNAENAQVSDEFGSTLELNVGQDVEHREIAPAALAQQALVTAGGDPVAVLAEVAGGWADTNENRRRLRELGQRADAVGRDRYPQEMADAFGQWLAGTLVRILNGRPETFDVTDARCGKLRYGNEFLAAVERILADAKGQVEAHVAAVGPAHMVNADILTACADRCRVVVTRLRQELTAREDFLLYPVSTGYVTASSDLGVYRRLVVAETGLRDQRAKLQQVLTRKTYADDALVNELYANYYAPYLESALDRLFWRCTERGGIELVVRHWEDRAFTTDTAGREAFTVALLELAEALGREIWRERLAGRLDGGVWRSDRVTQEARQLWVRAEPLLTFRPDKSPDAQIQRFVWASAEVRGGQAVAQQVGAVASGGGQVRQVAATDPYSAGMFTSLDVLPLPALTCYQRAEDEYLREHALVSGAGADARARSPEPVQVFPAEVHALAYERRLAELREPPRLFHPLFVAGLDDLARARIFALAYACGLVVRGYEDGAYRYGLRLPGERGAIWLPEQISAARLVDPLVEALQEFVLRAPAAPGSESAYADLAGRVEKAVQVCVHESPEGLRTFLNEMPPDLRDRRPSEGAKDFLSFARLVVRDTLLAGAA